MRDMRITYCIPVETVNYEDNCSLNHSPCSLGRTKFLTPDNLREDLPISFVISICYKSYCSFRVQYTFYSAHFPAITCNFFTFDYPKTKKNVTWWGTQPFFSWKSVMCIPYPQWCSESRLPTTWTSGAIFANSHPTFCNVFTFDYPSSHFFALGYPAPDRVNAELYPISCHCHALQLPAKRCNCALCNPSTRRFLTFDFPNSLGIFVTAVYRYPLNAFQTGQIPLICQEYC